MTGWKARFQVRRTHRVLIVKIMITNAIQGVVSIRDEMKDEQGLLSQNCPCLLISKFWASKLRLARRALSRRSLALDLSFSRLDLLERTLTFALRTRWPAGKPWVEFSVLSRYLCSQLQMSTKDKHESKKVQTYLRLILFSISIIGD